MNLELEASPSERVYHNTGVLRRPMLEIRNGIETDRLIRYDCEH